MVGDSWDQNISKNNNIHTIVGISKMQYFVVQRSLYGQ